MQLTNSTETFKLTHLSYIPRIITMQSSHSCRNQSRKQIDTAYPHPSYRPLPHSKGRIVVSRSSLLARAFRLAHISHFLPKCLGVRVSADWNRSGGGFLQFAFNQFIAWKWDLLVWHDTVRRAGQGSAHWAYGVARDRFSLDIASNGREKEDSNCGELHLECLILVLVLILGSDVSVFDWIV